MNRERRKRIDTVRDKLEELMEEIEALHDEEAEAYDNLPESLQESERGEAMSEAVDNLEIVASSIQEAIYCLESASDQ